MALYLGRDSFYDEEKDQHYFILKIGYTADENRDRRLLSYTSHNPSFKFLAEIPGGTEEQERKLHYKFREYLCHGNEWFKYQDEIIEFFKSCSLEEIDKIELPVKSSKTEERYPKVIVLEDWDFEVQEFFKHWNSMNKVYVDRIKYMCEFLLQFPEYTECILKNLKETDKIRQHYIALGPKRIIELNYNITRINQEMGIVMFDRTSLDKEIYSTFKVGERYSKKNLKTVLGNIYSDLNYKATPKANDIGNWFEIKQIQFSNKETGKRDMGFELISSKQEWTPGRID